MIELLFGFALGAALFFHVGWYGRKVMSLLIEVFGQLHKEPEPERPAVVTYGAASPPKEFFQSPQIISPKSPQQVKFEAEQAIRRENGSSL